MTSEFFGFVIINPTSIIPEFSLVGEKKIEIKEEEKLPILIPRHILEIRSPILHPFYMCKNI